MNTEVYPTNDAEITYVRNLGLEVALFVESVKAQRNDDLYRRYWVAVQGDRSADALELFRTMCAEMDAAAHDQKRHVRTVVLEQNWRDLIIQHEAHPQELAWQFRSGWSQGLGIFGNFLS